MWRGKNLLLFASLTALLYSGDGCQMDGVSNWLLTISAEMLDTHEGSVFSRGTSNIQAITGTSSSEGVDASLYLDVTLDGSNFVISTKEQYRLYEEYETSESMSFSVLFECTGGSTNTLVFDIQVIDTNNNAPIFKTDDDSAVYEFTIMPPLPPGVQITGCDDDNIVVRDVDLTTERIIFEIQDNPYFEIAYNGPSSTPKEFLGLLRTKNLIRTLSDVVELTIYATDVDRTGDEPITREATIRVKADDAFEFPEEPAFSQAFYLANYTADNQVVLEAPISLRQGVHEDVTFALDGEHSQYFQLVTIGDSITISVETPLPRDILRVGQLVLVVKATREYTSGDTTTVIVQLPEVLGLELEYAQYDGVIVDNVLQPLQLNLVQGYEDGFQVTLANEHASFFSVNVQGNAITLSMAPLTSQIINDNNFITIQVIASNDYSSTTAVVNLEIIKDDNVTPVFEKALYTGEYDGSDLTIETMTLVQGFDETVTFEISGSHEEYFVITNDEATVTLTTSGIPSQIWVEQRLYLTIEARKPRSVPSTAAISIQLPAARELAFQASSYSGTVQETTLTHQSIVLSTGYADDVTFMLTGDYASYFDISSIQNQVTISLPNALPDDVIIENNFLTLTLSANGVHALPATTAVVLEIIKQDITTPVFTENIYRANYLEARNIEIETIRLLQGYDNSVTFRIEGEHAQYFQMSNIEDNVEITLVSDIPPEVIFREKVLFFNVIADKPLTVGSHAAIIVTFPEELTDSTVMRFSQNTYLGSFEENELILENIVLETGYESGTVLTLTGEYASYFTLQNTNNEISIQIGDTPIDDIIEENSLILLEIEATRERAVPVSTTIVIDIVEVEIIHPIFNEAYYRGVYHENELQFDEVMSLTQGYDATVTFALEGELAAYFSIQQIGANAITLILNSNTPITEEVLENHNLLLFTIVANKLGAVSGRAAISIDLPKETPESVIIRFTQSSYVGHIENGELSAPTITLADGWEPVQLTLAGDYASYFEVSQNSNDVLIRLVNELPADDIDELSFILLHITASYPEAISGNTTVVLEIIKPLQIVTPVFEQAYYTGEYSQQGLQFDQSIRLIQGFDESVLFTLAGDDAQWFELVDIDENNLSVRITGEGLTQIRDRSHLIFSVVANKPDSPAARAAIIINLSDLLVTVPLRFSENFYTGTIGEGVLSLTTINLEEGYSPDITFTLIGDYADYFQVFNQEGIITLQFAPEAPDDMFEAHNVMVLSLEAEIENTRAHATIVLELINAEVKPLAFEEAYYVGSYSVINGFTFDSQITLTEGHDQTIEFSLEGDDSKWFQIVENQNFISLELENPISNDEIAGRQQLIFTIIARSPDGATTHSTIIITITDDLPMLSFERSYYIGTIENNAANIETISITETYSQSVTFTISGELADYFAFTSEGASVTISLRNSIEDDLLPPNGVIILELQASASQAVSAYTTLIFSVGNDKIVALNFSSTYYTGTYTQEDGLDFQDTITLIEGYDENVQFALEEDSAQYFDILVSGYSVELRLRTDVSIPSETVIDNQQLIFIIRADKPNARTARATIVISLSEVQNVRNLQFNQLSYLGSIENEEVSLDLITLSEGYTEDVSFTLHGELANYFNLVTAVGTVTVNLVNQIPEQALPNNGIILLELRATAPQARDAHATIVLHIVQENIEGLSFSQTYFTGTYTATDELIVEDTITLAEGYDENVQFTLEGDDSLYFEAVATNNTVTLRVTTPIPPAVTINNQVFVFSLHASRSGVIAKATIVITLSDEFTENTSLLGFNRITYSGKIENSTINMDFITLTEGYTSEVKFALYGGLADYFTLSNEGANVVLTLPNQIPDLLIPDNNIIVLELRASAPRSLSTFAAIIFEVVTEDETVEQLVFSEAYYTGQYETTRVTLERPITLDEGFDANVVFTLEGENSQYFEPEILGNSVTLTVSTSIPPAIISNNHHLIFTIRAEKPDAITARATIVISLSEERTDNLILGFDRISYQGTIENNIVNLDPITLREGYTQEVAFTLYGDLRDYFILTTSQASVTLSMPNSIPDGLIPENGIIVLELEASAPGTMSTHATIVFEIVREHNTPDIKKLVLSETFYTGRYSEIGGLIVDDIITLTEGYDENVQFTLEGDDSQYFGLTLSENTVTLRVIALIPPAVVTSNNQLVFAIRAEKPDAIAATATIVISLLNEFTENSILGFDRVTYIGSIENGASSLEAITLSEGYSNDITFTLHGDLANYFSLSNEGAIVSVTLPTPIPEQSLPDNQIIVLELRASAPETISAYATIVYEIVQENSTPDIEQLAFSDTFYTGHYTEDDGLVVNDITLTEGYDENVQFTLEGDDSQYFGLTLSENTVTLRVIALIPPAVVTSNNQLVFAIRAEKPDAIAATATIVISLLNDFTENSILGFDRVTYIGSIENGASSLEAITLSEGYSNDVTFTLHGDLANYFSLSNEGAIVSVTLPTPIPEQSLPDNQIIVLELRASAPETISAYATIVYEIVQENSTPDIEQLAFSDTFYTGHYTEDDGLVVNDITLTEGYDENVQFTLEGDDSQYFGLTLSENTVTLRVIALIPPAVVTSNNQLVFAIRAEKPDAIAATATIVISLLNDFTENSILGFDRVTYIGSIENGASSLEPITLSEGYSNDVTFTLHGDLANYFSLSNEGAIVSVTLPSPIPEQSLPDNLIIVLELRASAPETISAYATIVYEIVQENSTPDIEQLAFSDTFYTGHYTEDDGLVVNDITLTEGYDENVQFTLEGDDSQYFGLTLSENTVTLRVIALIPPAVVTSNNQLVFSIRAEKPDAIAATATIVISLLNDFTENSILGFDRVTYIGSIENGASSLEPITLSEGYSNDVTFTLHGDLANYFSLSNEGAIVSVTLPSPIPEQSLPNNRIIVLELRASAPETISAYATIVYEIVQENSSPDIEQLAFSDTFYTGHYTEDDGLVFNDITLTEGYDENVQFTLEGETAQYFDITVSGDTVTLTVPTPIPSVVIADNRNLIITIRADKPSAITARAVIVISLLNEDTGGIILGFDRISYQGSIENHVVNMDVINLNSGYTEVVSFTLSGDLADYFILSSSGPIVTLTLDREIPEQLIPINGIIVLELQASATEAISAYATIVLAYVSEENIPVANLLAFSDTYYTGYYTEMDGLSVEEEIKLTEGHDSNVEFTLEGESAQYFQLEISGFSVTLKVTSIPPAVVAGNRKLIFVIRADKPDAVTARATIIIALRDEYDEETVIIGFNRISYVGSIDNNIVTLEQIVLSEGYSEEITFTLHGDLVNFFNIALQGPIVSIVLPNAIPEESVPDSRIIVLELQASAPQTMSAYATIVFEVVQRDEEFMAFDAPYYVGEYTTEGNLIMESTILLSEGYDDNVIYHIEGEHIEWFYIEFSENEITLLLAPNTQIPSEVLENNRKLILVVVAQKSGSPSARSIIIISLPIDSENGGSQPGTTFEKVLFEGIVQEGVVRHDTIRLSGYEGNNIQLLGEFAELFEVSIADELVTVQSYNPLFPAADTTYIALQLQAGDAGAVLLLDIIHTENSELPTVSFGSTSYVLKVDVRQSGLIGTVQATADNNERVTYSLIVNNAHLLQRISINSDGELHLSAPANIGEYSFQVMATTAFSQAYGTATVQLTVDAISECVDSRALPPLTVLDRDEESAHRDLFLLNEPEYQGCTFTLRNLWPSEQSWLYLDDTGLHTHAIDREHESIAFMALSQVQVELIMDCDTDSTRSKRSVNTEPRLDHLGPYDYGDSTWLLGNTISHNPRRSIFNLIVNDINDNAPIFVGKEQEPIVVAYPIAELEERILPRALAEVEATDADVGENAAIVYWSREEVLAVSPHSGFVHVRNNARLENNTRLTILATDLNGHEQGLTASLQLLVKLIDTSHIAVITVQNAFLDDEKYIVGNLSASVGYEVKVLKSTVISEEITSETDETRSKRQAILSTGASLQLYVYGLLQQEPVDVQRLTEDLNVIETVSIADIISLEDHLENLQICPSPGRDIALLVSTIVLSVLLFILIVVAAVWYFLRWRKNRNYEEFSDEASLGTRSDSPVSSPKPESFPKPRINIEDLKKSERRLQEMLQTPVEEVTVEPVAVPKPVESKVNIPEAPIVIQSIDKLKDADESEEEDVFGERARDKRKSVVTFNENVEKIIHVEDPPDDSDFEVYRL